MPGDAPQTERSAVAPPTGALLSLWSIDALLSLTVATTSTEHIVHLSLAITSICKVKAETLGQFQKCASGIEWSSHTAPWLGWEYLGQ